MWEFNFFFRFMVLSHSHIFFLICAMTVSGCVRVCAGQVGIIVRLSIVYG